MSEWNQWNNQSGGGKQYTTYTDDAWGAPAPSSGKPTPGAGGWHVALTFVPLLATAVVAFAMALLTAGVPTRPGWLLALTFAVPVAVLMGTAFLIEKVTNAMTPTISRGYQAAFVAGTVVLAAAIGFFCQGTNVESRVVKEGWTDAIIILDKSSSMTWNIAGSNEIRDTAAVQAVLDLLRDMDDNTQVGLVLDRGTTDPTMVNIAPLSGNRSVVEDAVKMNAYGGTNFQAAVQAAADMVRTQYQGNTGKLNIIMVTDGEDAIDTSSLSSFFQSKGITFSYIRIGAEANSQLQRMVDVTHGESVSVNNQRALYDSMRNITVFDATHYDALRDIAMSSQAKLVVGILMLLLGILVGVSLTIMFSVQGQKRFQLFLSPLMAILAFLLLAFGQEAGIPPVVREGLAFTMIALICMNKNRVGSVSRSTAPKPNPSGTSSSDMW